MPNFSKSKGFQLRSGNKPGASFKMMGSSPFRAENAYAASEGNYDKPTSGKKPVATSTLDVEVENIKSIPTLENAVVKAPKPVEKNLSEGLNAAKGNTEEEKLQEQSKKEMYANAWQNSGVGHIVEAVKSIRRGIKKNKAKKAGKEAKKVIGNKLKNSVRKPKSKTANLKTAGIKGPTINAMGQTKFKDLSKTKIS